jgi:hypothetical protein
VLFKFAIVFFLGVLIGGTVMGLPGDDRQWNASDAEAAARYWIEVGTVQPARLDEGDWEVDVLRPDGSLVEVTLNDRLKLRDFDEELGPGGTWAGDEVRGPLRRQAIRAGLKVAGPGRVSSVERDSPDEVEVNVRPRNGTQIEVVLDAELQVRQVRHEDPGDE